MVPPIYLPSFLFLLGSLYGPVIHIQTTGAALLLLNPVVR